MNLVLRFTSVAVLVTLIAPEVARTSEEAEELALKPLGDSFTKPIGDSILLTCEITGAVENTNYNIKWLGANNREIIERSGRRYVEFEEESPSMKKLYITKIVREDAGNYTCSATIKGRQHQKTVVLRVFKDITFDEAPSPQHPKIYTNALIRCRVSGEDEMEVTWRYGGKRIAFAAGGRYQFDKRNGLRITNITTADNGVYTCRAEVDEDGSYDERKIDVRVHIPPKMTDNKLGVEGVEGTQAIISCKAEGLPQPKYEFYKQGSSVPLQSTDSVKVDGDKGQVVFQPLNEADKGEYTCKAINDVGEATAKGRLTVRVKPSITEMHNKTEQEGRSLVIDCRTRGNPPPNVTFHKDNQQPFSRGNNDGGIFLEFVDRGKTLRVKIRSLTPSHAGTYTCNAKNHLGHDEKSSTLTVQYSARFPSNHSRVAYAWAGSLRNVSCYSSGMPTPKIDWMVNNIVLRNNDTYHIYDLGATSHLQVKVREIDQTWIYRTFTCRARNELNDHPRTQNIALRRASVPGVPRDLNVTQRQPTMLVLYAKKPSDDGGMPVIGYRIQYDNKTLYDIDTTKDGRIRIENLKPNTNYTLSVRAKNEVGVGDAVKLTVVTEDISKPYPLVVSSSANAHSAYYYTLEWENPDTGGASIEEYEFNLREVKLTNDTEVVEPKSPKWQTFFREDDQDTPMSSFEFDDLKERTSYQVKIRTRNSMGWSEYNQPFVFTTSHETAADRARASYLLPLGVAAVIGISVVLLIVILIVIDVSCYFINSCGVTMVICTRLCGKSPALSKEKTAEEGESKEALTKQSPPNQDTNNVTASQDAQPTDGTAGGQEKEETEKTDDKKDESEDAGKDESKEKTPLVEPEKPADDEKTDRTTTTA